MVQGNDMRASSPAKFSLPSVVQLGFSGSRALFEGQLTDAPQALKLCEEFKAWFEKRFARIRNELQLEENQFFVGVSQLACGADMIFTKVCKNLSIPQRFFLPEHREKFLSAMEPDGVPDFTQLQRAEAEILFESDHVIQERVAASAPSRASRFEEVNTEIMRVSDAMICILREQSVGKPGGARQILQRAIKRGIPVLEIQVAEREGTFAVVVDFWHNLSGDTTPVQNLPDDLARLSLPPLRSGQDHIPERDEFCDKLMSLATFHANDHQRLFRRGAVVIIGTHILATVLATAVLAIPHDGSHAAETAKPIWLLWGMIGILSVEVVVLAIGFYVHRLLHHSRTVREWAIARVVCELVRSIGAIGSRHLYLEHFFRIPLPRVYRPLLRTLSILHLKATWPFRNQPWQLQRDQYISHRFDDSQHGQLQFFETSLKKDKRLLQRCQRLFTTCSIFAMVATGAKILMLSFHFEDHSTLAALGFLAVTFPVLAVAGLSWAAAFDCEARVETFEEALRFLHRQRPHLEQASSGYEFDQLLLETEAVLLCEIATWYSRRATKAVS